MPYTPPASSQVDLTLSAPLPDSAGLVLGATAGPQPYSPPPFDQVALVLDQPLPTNADLVLGGSGGEVTPDVFSAALSGTFGLRMAASARQIHAAQMQGAFGLRASMSAGYDNSVFRGLQTPVAAGFDSAAVGVLHRNTATWEPGTAVPVDKHVLFDEAPAQIYVVGVGWRAATPTPADAAIAHQQAATAHQHAGSAWGLGAPTHTSTQAQHQQATPVHDTRAAAYGHGAPTHRQQASVWDGAARPAGINVQAPSHRAAAAHRDTRHAPWQVGKLVISTGGPWTPWVPPPPPPPPVIANLRLCQMLGYVHPLAVHLVLGLDPCGGGSAPDSLQYILPARFYMAVHSVEAHLFPSLEPLPIFDVSLQSDRGSFGWTVTASGPSGPMQALDPTAAVLPPRVRITIDGLQWVFIVDSLNPNESFGKTNASVISGRSATALVGPPHREFSWMSTTDRTAQQLAASALELTGVGLDWGIDDWLVPAGAWSHVGTPLSAVQAIAEAAGGYLQSHRTDATVMVRHPYPTLPGGVPGGPWNWSAAAAADVELAPDVIISIGGERRYGADVDGIYVSGTAQGVLAHVKRSGTAGAKLASMVTNPLMTANIAAQQCGLSVLGAAGPKDMLQISMPVLTGGANPGVIDVGKLVQINDTVPWRARVRAVGVQAKMPTVRQSITLERHLA